MLCTRAGSTVCGVCSTGSFASSPGARASDPKRAKRSRGTDHGVGRLQRMLRLRRRAVPPYGWVPIALRSRGRPSLCLTADKSLIRRLTLHLASARDLQCECANSSACRRRPVTESYVLRAVQCTLNQPSTDTKQGLPSLRGNTSPPCIRMCGVGLVEISQALLAAIS